MIVKLWQWFVCVCVCVGVCVCVWGGMCLCVCVCVCGHLRIGKTILSLAYPASCTPSAESPSGFKAARVWRYHQILSISEVQGRVYTCTRPLGFHRIL